MAKDGQNGRVMATPSIHRLSLPSPPPVTGGYTLFALFALTSNHFRHPELNLI